MSVAKAPFTLARMIVRRSNPVPAPREDLPASGRADVRDPAGVHARHFQEWRDAAIRVTRTYKAWCAASRPERRGRHLAFLDALLCEERAARQVERDASAVRAADRVT
jgi:hypothetical protein